MQTSDVIAIVALAVSLLSSVFSWRATISAARLKNSEKRTYVVSRVSAASSIINKISYEMDFLISFTEPKSKEATELFRVSANRLRSAGERIELMHKQLMSNKEYTSLEMDEMLRDIESSISIANERLDKIASLKRIHDLKF